MRVFTTSIGVVTKEAMPEETNPTPMFSQRDISSIDLIPYTVSMQYRDYPRLHVPLSEHLVQGHLPLTGGDKPDFNRVVGYILVQQTHVTRVKSANAARLHVQRETMRVRDKST